MEIQKYRILEETTVFADGSRQVEFTLQCQHVKNPKEWDTLGKSRTLADARRALLFHAPSQSLGFA